MSISSYKTWSAGEVLTAADLNASFTNIISNAADLVSPFTKNISAGSFKLTTLAAATTAGDAVRYEQIGPSICEFRLTLTTAVPVTTTDVTGATTVYCTPYKGNRIGLYNGTSWDVITSAEFSLALGTLTSGKPYDVFCYNNGGTATLEFLVWTNDTTRATALVLQDGIYCKTGALTRRYLGTFYTTAATTTEDSNAKRLLWNYYNRVTKPMAVFDTTNSWNYTTATLRQANGSTANQLEFLVGVSEDMVNATVLASATNATGTNPEIAVSIGLNSTSAVASKTISSQVTIATANAVAQATASWRDFAAAGRNLLVWLEWAEATGTTSWLGDNGGAAACQSGIQGEVKA